MTAQSSQRFKAVGELDAQDITLASSEPAANENADPPGQDAPEPDTKTRAHTHVTPDAWFDAKLDTLAALDPRQALAWRYEAAFAAHTLLLPHAPNAEARELLVNVLRRYEKRVRSAAGSADERTAQTTLALHALLDRGAVEELEPVMSELEVTLLTIDECVSEDQFRRHFTRQHVEPKLLLQYARFLAGRGFDIGYQRDRFEHLAQEILTSRLPSGKLLLTSRKRAANAVLRLTRGLKRPDTAALAAPLSYLRDSLDRLQNLTRAKQFFDSGFFLDISGYKISKPELITSPEFVYLCVALDVEVHNSLLAWSREAATPTKPAQGELAALQAELGQQLQAARAAFAGFQLPLGAAGAREAKKPKRRARTWSLPRSTLLRTAAACLLLAVVVCANLYALGVLRVTPAPEVLSTERVAKLSPLLLEGQLTDGGRRFAGTVARPTWNRMPARERKVAAETFAQALKAQGIDHGEVLAYKTRVIQVDYGSVVFVEEPSPQ